MKLPGMELTRLFARSLSPLQEDFRAALSRINSSVSDKDIHRHEEWLSAFGAV